MRPPNQLPPTDAPTDSLFAELRASSSASLGKGTAIAALGTVLFFVLSFVGRVTAARELSVADWGTFSLGLSLTSLLATLGLLGLAQATARTIASTQDPASHRTTVRWVLAVATAPAVTASAIVYFAAGAFGSAYGNPELTIVLQGLSVTIGFTVLATVLAAVFQGFHDAFPNALFNQIVNPAVFVVAVAIAYVEHWGLAGVVGASVVGSAAAFLGLVAYSYPRIPRVRPPPGPRWARPDPVLWRLGVALWGVNSLAFVTAFADTLILGIYRPATEVGYYSAAMNLARLVLLGGTAVTFIYLPVATELERHKAYDAMRSIYVTASRWILLFTVPFFLLFVFAPDFSLEALFGSRYGPASISLRILATSAFVSGALGPVNASLTGLAHARLQLFTSTTSAGMNIVLSFALIPTYGTLGASVAWAIARGMYPALGLVAVYGLHRLTPFRGSLLEPLALSVVIGGSVTYLVGLLHPSHYWIIPLFVVDLLLYPAAILVTRSVVADDLVAFETLEGLVKRRFPRLRRVLGSRLRRAAP